MKDTHALRTFYDGCDLSLRYDGGTAHFELWIPGEEDPEPLATIPAIGGELSWALSGLDLLEHYDEGRGEMIPVDYAEDLQHLIDSYAALQGDRRRYSWDKKWNVWEVSDADDDGDDNDDEDDDDAGEEEDEKNLNPLVIACDGERLDLVTYRDDPKAGFVGWRIYWDGDAHHAPSDGDAPEVYYLVETCSQQYSKEHGAATYGTQAWRIERGKVTHNAWFAWSSDPAKAVKELADVYTVAGWDGSPAIPPVDVDNLRVVESANNACCYIVY